jgi:hypothetical protein
MVTSGEPGGTSGGLWTGFWRGAAVIVLMLAVICTINVLSTLHDAARIGRVLPAWEPISWEATSAVCSLAACVVIWLALRLAPPVGRWLRFAAIHGVGTVVFSAVHVVGMVALRQAVYAAAGHRYVFAPGDVVYEYRKDVLTYAGFAALLWLVPRLTARAGSPEPTPEPLRVEVFDIQEGTRLLRVPVGEILAVRAAGNYVEFLLRDGRRPLMRAPLGEIEAALSPNGFLRTHRSWVVNAARVRGLEPSGSGDYQLALEGGDTAPVSRRFPQALERLRGGPRAPVGSE